MERKKEGFEKYLKAKNRVDNIKTFYTHLIIFIIANLLIFVFKSRVVDLIASKGVADQGFLNWLEWNMAFIPIIWGLILLFSGIYLFKLKPGFFKDWEERQIEKYLKENE